MANHIIFLQPYYTAGENAQEKYSSAMTQAIGRARRWGQEKNVHVYYFLSVNTIDIDYYEARNNVIITRKSEDASQGVYNKAEEGWTTDLGTYFAKTMQFDEALRNNL